MGSGTSSQVTTALGYTPANKAGDTFTGSRPITISTTTGSVQIKGDAAGWSTGTLFYGSSGTYRGGFGALGSVDALTYFWIGPDYNNNWLEIASTYVNSKVALQQSGNQVLHAGNYTSYSPSLTGGGASGTWGINITGNAATVSSITSGQVTGALGYTPIQQGGGTGQGTNKLYIGWSGSQLLLQIDSSNFGASWPINVSGSSASCSGNASTATTASTANALNTGNGYQINALGVGTAHSGVAGEIRATNNVTAYYSSDARLKENFRPLVNPLQMVKAIRGVRYDWTAEYIERAGGEDGYFVRKQDVGVIAQEIEAVLPEIVADREDGYKAVRYERLTALLIEAVKELSGQVDGLKAEIEALKGAR